MWEQWRWNAAKMRPKMHRFLQEIEIKEAIFRDWYHILARMYRKFHGMYEDMDTKHNTKRGMCVIIVHVQNTAQCVCVFMPERENALQDERWRSTCVCVCVCA